MATKYGANYKKNYVDVPATKSDPGEQTGRILVAYDEYDLTVDAEILSIGDVVKLFKLPEGARLHEVKCYSDNLDTTGIFKMGWEDNGTDAADDDGIFASVDAGGQAVVANMTDSAAATGIFKKFSAETQISLTMTEASVGTTGLKIKVAAFYTIG